MKTAIFRWVNYAIIDNSAQIWHIYNIYIYTLTSYIYIYTHLLHIYIYIHTCLLHISLSIYMYKPYIYAIHGLTSYIYIYYMCLWTISTHTDIWSKSRATAAGPFPGSHSYGEQIMIYWSTLISLCSSIFHETIYYIYLFQFSWTYFRA